MPNEEEIRKIMEKARKAASGGKAPPEKKPKPEIKSERKPLVQEKPEEEKKPDSSKSSPEIAELKTLIIQQNQNITQQNERVGAIENFLKEAQRQAQAQAAQETSQSNADQDENLIDEERLAQAQAEQDKGGQGVPGQPQIPANVPPALAYLYAFNPTFKEIASTVRTAIAKGKAEKEGSEVSLDSLGRELIVGLIKRQLLGQAEGGDNLDQIKTYANMQNVLMGSFFNTLKYLGKEGAQRVMGNIFEETVSPRSTLPTPSPSEGHIV